MTRSILAEFEGPEELSKAAAKEVANRINSLLASQAEVNVVVTGGSVGMLVLGNLAQEIQKVRLDHLHIWFSDERFLPTRDLERNETQARQCFFDKVAIPENNIHAFPSDFSQGLEKAAGEFERGISSRNPKFDLVLLGMGPDGHVASLFSDSDQKFHGHWTVSESNSPKPPAQRLSLSFEALCNSDEVWFLVAGEEKADVVKRVLNGEDFPATKVNGKLRTIWFLDKAAAEKTTS